jgi:hypothetical protein
VPIAIFTNLVKSAESGFDAGDVDSGDVLFGVTARKLSRRDTGIADKAATKLRLDIMLNPLSTKKNGP